MYAAFRWVQSLGGTRIVAIGRQELLGLYGKAGLRTLHRRTQPGAVTYELLSAPVVDWQTRQKNTHSCCDGWSNGRIGDSTSPSLPAACHHGGAFFEAIGEEFDHSSAAAT